VRGSKNECSRSRKRWDGSSARRLRSGLDRAEGGEESISSATAAVVGERSAPRFRRFKGCVTSDSASLFASEAAVGSEAGALGPGADGRGGLGPEGPGPEPTGFEGTWPRVGDGEGEGEGDGAGRAGGAAGEELRFASPELRADDPIGLSVSG
jgi:hypothetical protein